MSMEKAYKLLAIQEGISNNEAKALIDNGLVSAKGEKIVIARALISTNTKFNITKVQKPTIIFEDENLMALNKPATITSENIAKEFGYGLLHRLDKDTSGVLVLYKNEEFRQKAIKEFKNLNVKKTYLAIVKGVVSEEFIVDDPIFTTKTNSGAHSKISPKGKSAISQIYPLMAIGKKSLVKVDIKTGRTHQIRVHLSSRGHAIVGDEKYGQNRAKRMYLHAYYLEILDYVFKAPLDKSFKELGFDILV